MIDMWLFSNISVLFISCIIYRAFNIGIIKFLSFHCLCFCMGVIS